MVSPLVRLEVVVELVAYQVTGLLLDLGKAGRPVERARPLDDAFVRIGPPRRLFDASGQPEDEISQGGKVHSRSRTWTRRRRRALGW
ncbi:MAG: hypothetical protein ACRDNS_15805 [Trebonia sp.]